MQYELSQEELDLLKAGLYISFQQDKIRKCEIFTAFEKIHRSFITNLKFEETKSEKKHIYRILLILIFTTKTFSTHTPSTSLLTKTYKK